MARYFYDIMNEIKLLDVNSLYGELKSQNFNFSPSTIYNTIQGLNIKPYKVEILPNKRRRFYYSQDVLISIANELSNKLQKKEYRRLQMGSCYVCGQYSKTLTSGLCIKCHADKMARNYTNKGTMFDYIYDEEKAQALLSAIQNIIQKYQNQY